MVATNAAVKLDPYHVQIGKQMFADIIGRSVSQLDQLRKDDPRCPQGYRTGKPPRSIMHWRLSEAYEYSEVLLQDALNNKVSTKTN